MIGQRIGQYRVIREIGRGGMGLVFEAQHETMPRLRAAIKVLYASATRDELQRFEREARVLSGLHDSGIVRLEDFGTLENGSLYLRMEYLEGETLDHRLSRLRRLPARQALELARQMATTLSRIHSDRILHRDLKPANIMIVRDSQADGGELARLLDFGIAKLLCPDQQSSTGQPLGTPLYMSPEQGDAKATLSDRSDVYQLGLVLYEMLSGSCPFEVSCDSLPIALHIQRLTEPPTPLHQHLPSLPAAVADLVYSMLQRSPQARPTMATTAQRLKQLLAELPSDADWGLAPVALPSRSAELASGLRDTTDGDARPEISVLSAELAARSSMVRLLSGSRWRFLLRGLTRSPRQRELASLAVVMTLSASSLFQPAEPKTGQPENQEQVLPWNKLDCASTPKVPGMVCIPGGTFTPGLTQDEANEHERRCLLSEAPARCEKDYYSRQLNEKEVWVPTFQIDQLEATNAQYAKYMNLELGAKLASVHGIFVYLGATPTAALKEGSALYFDGAQFRVRPGHERKPVGYVTWYGAQSYCRKRGAHLPTEAQWEYAARGSSRRSYPWGEAAPTCQGVAFGRDDGLPCSSDRGARDVGSSVQDSTPEGVFDLAGNLQEWVANHFDLHVQLSCRNGICLDEALTRPLPLTAGDTPERSVRGGTWIAGGSQLYSAWRSRWEARMADVSLGFRCAATINQTP